MFRDTSPCPWGPQPGGRGSGTEKGASVLLYQVCHPNWPWVESPALAGQGWPRLLRRGRCESSWSHLSFGEICAHRPRDPTCCWSQQLGRVPAAGASSLAVYLPRISCLKSHTCIHFALSSWRSNLAKAMLFAQYHMLLGVWTLIFSPAGFFFI